MFLNIDLTNERLLKRKWTIVIDLKQFKEMSFNIKEIIKYSFMFIVEQLFLQHLKFVGEKLKKNKLASSFYQVLEEIMNKYP